MRGLLFFAFGEQGSALHPPETFLEKGFWTSKNFWINNSAVVFSK